MVSNQRAAHQAAQQAWEKVKAERAAELEQAKSNVPRAVKPLLPVTPATRASPARALVASAPVQAGSSTNVAASEIAPANNVAPPTSGKRVSLQDPLAREALSYVGVDPDAEEVWLQAINNPDLPPKERQDLIEDLNEDGFADPKNPGPDDLPLILSRIQLIEELIGIGEHAPDAMDEVNLAAFMEAYKDLLNMAARLMQQ